VLCVGDGRPEQLRRSRDRNSRSELSVHLCIRQPAYVRAETRTTAWRDRSNVVVLNDGELPARCVRCGGPGLHCLQREVRRASGVPLVLIVASWRQIAVWLCDRHFARLNADRRVRWLGLALVVVMFVVLITLVTSFPPGAVGARELGIILLVGLVGGGMWIYSDRATRLVRATHIGPTGDVWLAGIAPATRNTLPTLPRSGR
jgi:hypothetical protein